MCRFFFIPSRRITPGSPTVSDLGQIYFPVRIKALLSADWTRLHWSVHGQIRFTDSYQDSVDQVCDPKACTVASWMTTDFGLRYAFGETGGFFKGVTVDLSILNAFDRDPPYVPGGYGLGYDPSHANPIGREVAFGLRKRW